MHYFFLEQKGVLAVKYSDINLTEIHYLSLLLIIQIFICQKFLT